MSIVGVTIDYGPYGFIDSFDPNFICNNSGKKYKVEFKNRNKKFLTPIFKLLSSCDHMFKFFQCGDLL